MGALGGSGFAGGPTTGSPYTSVDTYNSALENNGATCPLGTRYTYPFGVQLSATAGGFAYQSSNNGAGAPLTICYVRYNSTTNASWLAAPGVVYWQDETFTTVTGTAADSSLSASSGYNAIAGVVLINTTNYPGSYTGTTLKPIIQGNFIWIVVGGLVPGMTSAGSVAAGDYLIGSGTAFTPARMTAGTAPTNRVVGLACTAVSGGLSDVYVGYGVNIF